MSPTERVTDLSRSPASPRKRVLLVEDHVLVREALAEMLESSGEWSVCGQTDNGRTACELAAALQPDVILLDFVLAGHDGFELVRRLSTLNPAPAVLVLSVMHEREVGERVVRAGARGFLNKRADTAVLLRSMREVCEGRVVVSAETKLRIASSRLGDARTTGGPLDQLSDREFEILCLLGSGLAVSEIGERLGLSPRTVESHRENIKNKLHLQLASEVVQWARAWCLGSRTSE